MNAHRILSLIALASCIILLTTTPAAARATRIDYEAYECTIPPWGEPDRSWISEDGVLHMRGVRVVNLIDSENPYMAGINQLTMNVDLNPATGEGHAYGTVLLTPYAKNGTWEGRFSTQVLSTGIRGKAVGHGTGELTGMKMFNQMSNLDPNNPCNTSEGYILVP